MMFVTKRGLAEACTAVGSHLDQVSDSVVVSFFLNCLFPFSLALHSETALRHRNFSFIANQNIFIIL